jgi:hypothetical protein
MATSQSDDSDRRLFPVCSLCNLRTSLASLFRAGPFVFRARRTRGWDAKESVRGHAGTRYSSRWLEGKSNYLDLRNISNRAAVW